MPTEPTHLTAEELEIQEIVNRVSRAKQVLHDDDPALTLRAAVKLVDSLEAARRELAEKWIAVTERLPEDTRMVNVLLCGTVASSGHYNHGKKLWRPFTAFKGELYGVTAWQPLPAPPAQQEGQ